MSAWRTTSRKVFLNETEVNGHSTFVAICLQLQQSRKLRLFPMTKWLQVRWRESFLGKGESARRSSGPLPDLIR
jgi:hypothetical protein